MNWVLVAAALSLPPALQGGPKCEALAIEQRTYHEVSAELVGRQVSVYFYVPDIKTPVLGSGFSPFDLWIVEGVYAKPFALKSGRLGESEFAQIRRSGNVRAKPLRIEYDAKSQSARLKPEPLAVAAQRFTVEIARVRTGWIGADTVTVKICR